MNLANRSLMTMGTRPFSKLDSTAAAEAFSEASTYEVGDKVSYRGEVWECHTAITTGNEGPWTGSSNWNSVILTDLIDEAATSLLDGLTFSFSDTSGLITAVKDAITSLGGTVTDYPGIPPTVSSVSQDYRSPGTVSFSTHDWVDITGENLDNVATVKLIGYVNGYDSDPTPGYECIFSTGFSRTDQTLTFTLSNTSSLPDAAWENVLCRLVVASSLGQESSKDVTLVIV